MKIYLVGGAVRDKLLGRPIKERDWVVVGATPDEMISQGFRQVGKEFPVFLHPKTNEEYALARMEQKVSRGYQGFRFDTSNTVSLEADLQRRDLTINAMAMDTDGQLIDPYHGKQDLEQQVLRHVSAAFAEDPVRILRVGRFLARYAHLGFTVAPQTLELMRHMVETGEVDALVAERVWKELERSLKETNPEKFFEALEACGALARLFPELAPGSMGMDALVASVPLSSSAVVRFSALCHDLPEAKQTLMSLVKRYRIPNAYKELALLTAQHYKDALSLSKASTLPVAVLAEQVMALFSTLDIFRREHRFTLFLTACKAIAHARHLAFDALQLSFYARLAQTVDVQILLDQGLEGMALAKKLYEIRLQKIVQALSQADGLL